MDADIPPLFPKRSHANQYRSPRDISVSLIPSDGSSPLPLLERGEPVGVDEVRAKQILENEDIEILVKLGLGMESAKYWTCDFSYVSAWCQTSSDSLPSFY